ncbi:MAG: SDR family oxidoreductase, partial [Rhizobacter sp.]|nr:SDR family oxidoreductase [Chlorobiales bacterium]
LRSAGKIINISSVHQVIMWSYFSSYCATKGGIKLFMESVAQEVAEFKIRVNSVAPGAIRTPINQDVWGTDEGMKALLKMIPYNRIGEVDDVAAAVAFLASEEADYITGTTLFVDGGMTLYPEFRYGG